MEHHQLYLIEIPPGMIKIGKHVTKFGKHIDTRVKTYTPGSVLRAMKSVNNCHETEKLLIQAFKAEFGDPISGAEYFHADLPRAIRLFDEICNFDVPNGISRG